MRRMEVDKLGIDLITQDPVVILKDIESKKYLPIIIGPFEATAIALALEGTPVPRPLTHDLMKNIINVLGAKVSKIVIYDIKDNTFLATIYIHINGEEKEIDSRPSDSIALALRTNSPIFVSDKIVLEGDSIQESGHSSKPSGQSLIPPKEDLKHKEFRKFLDNLKPSDFKDDLGDGNKDS
jgi:bifunctional DNase/RNase